ncbi:AbrB/MazE/SpoVT family DNA-binding domain-containing protein [Chlorogloeopsis fritschii PCC 9212]|uniref:Addiction module antidote protein n=1 Tax=Chlorogloeopsis fritschii PCC 6912 TaxID=211165 RepID=A0A3S1FRW1_CHLFR|nr:AbrB/MazE/SpoVT family DNA-binding domain-containing protein [Chlorogloeopsis fritschii]MBF2009210.1 AbrB/MazE/SpoVT family DNA-binding domain-containing protein [Chlorogloeopsis fritschii C42_A2020_084]RUR84454.1 addiction module antidote protein [Chlorogloeopsis fritschii PCC 6912]
MHAIKIRQIGNSLGVTLPKEVLHKLNLKEGDTIYLTETTDGFQITPYDPDFEAAMQAFAETRKNYRNALRELAK